MNARFVIASAFWLMVCTHQVSGQLNKLKDKLKEKADQLMEADPSQFLNKQPEEIVKDQLIKKTEAEQASLDTTTFIYTIAFLDKSESFENQQKNEKLIKTAGLFLSDGSSPTPREEANTLYEIGRFNYLKRSYWLAEVNLKAAVSAFELLQLHSDPVYLKSLGTLALLYNDMGRYDAAMEKIDLALAGWNQYFGEASKGSISTQHNRAVIIMNQGKFATAEKAFLALNSKIQVVEGIESMPSAIAGNNMAILNLKLGRADEAAQIMNNAIQIANQSLKEKSGTYIQLLTNQALIYQQNKRYDLAESTYLNAKNLQESRLKLNRSSDPDYAHLLSNMAALYMYKGELKIAGEYLNESLNILKNKYGERYPSVAAIYYELGTLARLQSNWKVAELNYENAYQIRKEVLGERHPVTTQSLYGLSVAEWYAGNPSSAKQKLENVIEQSLIYVNDFFASMSEVEKTSYWDQIRPYFHTYYNYAAQASDPKEYISNLVRYRTATKGILLSSSTKLKNSIIQSNDPELIQLYDQWIDQKKSLANFYALTKEELANQKINLDSLERQANFSERKLSEKSGVFKGSFTDQQGVSVEELQAQLKSGEGLVEIIQFPQLDKVLTLENQYVALVLTGQQVRLINLPAEVAEKKSFAAYKNLIRLKVADQRSYGVFWQLIDQQLEGVDQLYVSPDGVYHQINISTLLTPNGEYIIDKYTTHLIGNPENLIEKTAETRRITNAFLLGYPEYMTSDVAPLPGTDKEVTAIGNLLTQQSIDVEIKKKADATEGSIKRVQNPDIFHVATHGFFMEDASESSGDVFGVKIDQVNQNPLLKSGLLLASIQQKGFSGFEDADNGILNAFEAVNLDLSSTRLVVLSACETGQGDIKSGEGVYGLQRAFKLAGADQLMMSLWKVDDNATQELMVSFYQNWIKNASNPVDAFRQAQLEVRANFPPPYYWGAFVMIE